MMKRKIRIGNLFIGGDEEIKVQSMTKSKTEDVRRVINEIRKLEEAGCEIVRVAIPDEEAANALKKIKRDTNIPIVADIHFDYKLALISIENGADKIRINPGNIGSEWKVREVVKACKERGIPIRVGVNSGSIRKDILKKYNGVNKDSMLAGIEEEIRILNDMDFHNIVLSAKATDLRLFIEANEEIDKRFDYPIHIGVTESGPVPDGIVKSSIGIGYLILKGIGNTIRVSLTESSVKEVEIAFLILSSTDKRRIFPEIISCPTCGRTEVDTMRLVKRLLPELRSIKKPLKVAIMGCSVNGPGEAKEADIGIAGGKGFYLLFRKGEIIREIKEDDVVKEFLKEIKKE
uniref:4-hydroxy-3-methylbut-2-en-1-yl diphosphate synthase (flavodoxin) n=1 Tax=candidate division WOR-3 bacterium TaxID=2052148 RepID=A0A7C4Y5F7_UNCW3